MPGIVSAVCCVLPMSLSPAMLWQFSDSPSTSFFIRANVLASISRHDPSSLAHFILSWTNDTSSVIRNIKLCLGPLSLSLFSLKLSPSSAMNGDRKDKKNISSESNDYLNEIMARCLGPASHWDEDSRLWSDSCLPASSQITANFLVLLKTPGSEAVLSPLLRSEPEPGQTEWVIPAPPRPGL